MRVKCEGQKIFFLDHWFYTSYILFYFPPYLWWIFDLWDSLWASTYYSNYSLYPRSVWSVEHTKQTKIKQASSIYLPFINCVSISYRSLSAMRALENDELDLEGGRSEKGRDKTIRGSRAAKMHNQALLSGFAYCISSCSMILVNKFVLSSYNFDAGISLMLYQVIS